MDYADRAASVKEAGDAGAEFLPVLGCPSLSILGGKMCPELTAELGPSGITAEPGVLWWDPRESTAPWNSPGEQPHFWAGAGQNDCCGSWGWDQGEGGSSQASSPPSSVCGSLWGAGQAAWPLLECPGTKTLAEGVEKNAEHQRGRKWRALTAGGAQQSQFPPGRWPHCKSSVPASLACPQPAAIPSAWPKGLEEPWWGAVPFPACPTVSSGQSQSRETHSDLTRKLSKKKRK